MKAGIFLACLGIMLPVQIIAAALIVRYEIRKQSLQPTTDWLSVCGVSLLAFSMWVLPIVMAALIFARFK